MNFHSVVDTVGFRVPANQIMDLPTFKVSNA
jgi:hypothetical protein